MTYPFAEITEVVGQAIAVLDEAFDMAFDAMAGNVEDALNDALNALERVQEIADLYGNGYEVTR